MNLGILTPTENLQLGCAAGVGTKVLNYPILVAKNHIQQGLPVPRTPSTIYRGGHAPATPLPSARA